MKTSITVDLKNTLEFCNLIDNTKELNFSGVHLPPKYRKTQKTEQATQIAATNSATCYHAQREFTYVTQFFMEEDLAKTFLNYHTRKTAKFFDIMLTDDGNKFYLNNSKSIKRVRKMNRKFMQASQNALATRVNYHLALFDKPKRPQKSNYRISKPFSFTTTRKAMTAHALKRSLCSVKDHTSSGQTYTTDNGSDFAGRKFVYVMQLLGSDIVYCEPYAPDQKPHVERWFKTHNIQCAHHLNGTKKSGVYRYLVPNDQ